MKKPPAPLFTDAYALCEWLLGRLDAEPSRLARSLCDGALALLDAVTLALKGRDREVQLDRADERLITLRIHLRLAGSTGLLGDNQVLHALDYADRIGRQLGGWQRHLESA